MVDICLYLFCRASARPASISNVAIHPAPPHSPRAGTRSANVQMFPLVKHPCVRVHQTSSGGLEGDRPAAMLWLRPWTKWASEWVRHLGDFAHASILSLNRQRQPSDLSQPSPAKDWETLPLEHMYRAAGGLGWQVGQRLAQALTQAVSRRGCRLSHHAFRHRA